MTKIGCVVAVLVLLGCGFVQTPPVGAEVNNLVVSDITPVAAVIAFTTQEKTDVEVLVSGVFSDAVIPGQAEERSFFSITKGWGVLVHRCQVLKMLPLTPYDYKVLVDGKEEAGGDFTTAKYTSIVPLPSCLVFCWVEYLDHTGAVSLAVFTAQGPKGSSVPLSIITSGELYGADGLAFMEKSNLRYDNQDKDFISDKAYPELHCFATDGVYEGSETFQLDWTGSPYEMGYVVLRESEPEPIVIYGDIDCNEEVTRDDIRLLSKYLRGKVQLSDYQLIVAEVSGDGAVNYYDLWFISAYVRGKINEFPIESQ